MTESALDAVRALVPAIAAAAADVDRTGVVDADVVEDLHHCGFFSMLQPRAFGGLEVDPDEFLTATREISAACTSTGWLAAMLAVNTWHLALFDVQAQHDVWDPDTHALVCTSYAPAGRLERAGDTYRLSGRWPHCTGANHATWFMAGALLVGADGGAEDFLVALVPRAAYAVEPTWNGLGLRGIGAHDVVVSDARVPAYHTFGWVSGEQRAALAPLYRLPQPTMYNHTGGAPLVGAALGVLATRRAPDTTALSPVAMAICDMELSVLQTRRNVTELMDSARAGVVPGGELMLRSRRDQVVASERAMRAVQMFIGDRDEIVERVWRDMQTARLHVANDIERVLSVAGQFAFGLEVDEVIL